MKATTDPLKDIPEPETVQRLLADAVRRSDLLRGLLRLARRKAAYSPADPVKPAVATPPIPQVSEGVTRG